MLVIWQLLSIERVLFFREIRFEVLEFFRHDVSLDKLIERHEGVLLVSRKRRETHLDRLATRNKIDIIILVYKALISPPSKKLIANSYCEASCKAVRL